MPSIYINDDLLHEHLAFESWLSLRPLCWVVEEHLGLAPFKYGSSAKTQWGWSLNDHFEINISRPYEPGKLQEWDDTVPPGCNFAVTLVVSHLHPHAGDHEWAKSHLVSKVGQQIADTLHTSVYYHRTRISVQNEKSHNIVYTPQTNEKRQFDEIKKVLMKRGGVMLIHAYKYQGAWVFDHEKDGFIQEPFVSSADTMIDKMVENIPNAEAGFTFRFSASPLRGDQIELEWKREENGGNWYHSKDLDMEGCLCPALFKHFDKAPEKLYVAFAPKDS